MQNFVAPQGINLRCADQLLPDALSVALLKTVGFLQSIEPPGAVLYKYADWWEHDGLHFEKGVFDFAILFQMVQSPAALLKAMPGDFLVFVGVTPQDFEWYLRFYLEPDATEDDQSGRFDLTLRLELIEPYKEVIGPLGLEMQEQESDEYYRSIQA